MRLRLAAGSHKAKLSSTDKRSRKSSFVYQDMKRKILIGDLTSDSPITEQSLAHDYDCSQSTIREVLLSLQEEGLVIRRGYQGTYVTETTNDEAAVMLRLRQNIETAAMVRVQKNITPDCMAHMRKLSDMYDDNRQKRDVFGVSEADIEFHLTLLQIADMPVLEPVLLRTMLHLHRFIITRNNGSIIWLKDVKASHTAILDAIEADDNDQLYQLVMEHTTTNIIEITPEIRKVVITKPELA
ncbi:MAG: GntR family transcriptional regulator [Roseibium sp.]